MTETLVRADFLRDAREQLADRLRLSGISLPASYTVDQVTVRYFDYKRRHVPARPRSVVRSREFDQLVLSADHQAGVQAIVEDSTAGRTLLPYFSRAWMNLEHNDILFNDWHVCHMHLGGRAVEPDGFVRRTGPVLFVYVTDDKLYLIDVIEHGSGHPTTFAKLRILQILHDNWPKLIEHGKLHGLSNVRPNDDESRRQMTRRRKGAHFTLGAETSDGTVYGLIGGGYMVDGRSMIALRMSDELLNDAVHLQEHYTSVAHSVREQIDKDIGLKLDELHLRLVLKHITRGVELTVMETQARAVILRNRRHVFPQRF